MTTSELSRGGGGYQESVVQKLEVLKGVEKLPATT